jgi:hypothetical protein
MARKLYSSEIYLSPSFAIKRFLGLRQKYGDKAALTKSEFKPEREAWITAVFLLGLGKLAGREFWLRPNNEDSAPDVITVSFAESDEGVVAQMQNVEIFEYESHAETDLAGAIKNKLSGKAYPDDYILLCYVHSRAGETFSTKEIFEKVSRVDPKVSEVWVLSSILSPTSSEHVVFQAFPKYNVYKFDYLDELKASRQRELIHTKKGFVKQIEFVPMGKYIFKLP